MINDFNCRTVLVNGQNVSIGADGSFPQLRPKVVPADPYLVMPAFSLVFWQVRLPELKICL